MAYIGNQPADKYSTLSKQTITGDGTTGPYTLDYPAATAQDIEVFVNNVRQEPGVAYTVSDTALTMTGAVASTDDFYVVFQGRAVQTTTHPAGQTLQALDAQLTGDLKLETSSGGVYTVTGTDTSTDRTLTLPDEAGTILTTTGDGSSLTGIPASGFVPVYSVDSSPGAGVVDVDDIFSATYEKYYISFYIRPATTNTYLYARLLSSGTLYSTDNYRQALGGAESTSSGSNDTQSRQIWDDGEWNLTPAGGGTSNNTAAGGIEGNFTFCGRNESGEAKKIIGECGMIRDGNDTACASSFFGIYDTSETVSYTGLRFYFSAGNVAEFRLQVYGMAGA